MAIPMHHGSFDSGKDACKIAISIARKWTGLDKFIAARSERDIFLEMEQSWFMYILAINYIEIVEGCRTRDGTLLMNWLE